MSAHIIRILVDSKYLKIMVYRAGFHYDSWDRAISVKAAALQRTFANIGFTQDLVRDFGLPTEFKVTIKHWKALHLAADLSITLNEFLEELKAQDLLTPVSRSDIKIALDHFELDPYIRDTILDFTEPISSGMMALELYQQRRQWKFYDEMLTYDGICSKVDGRFYPVPYSRPKRGAPKKDSKRYPVFYDLELKHAGSSRKSRFQPIKDFGLPRSDILFYKMASILQDNDRDALDRFCIGFLEVTGQIIRKKFSPSPIDDISYEKILVIYDSRETRAGIFTFPKLQVFQPSNWSEYVSKLDLKRKRNNPREMRIKFTTGPTIREAIYQNVSNDVKVLIGEMVQEVISFLQAGCRFWGGILIESFLTHHYGHYYGREVNFINGWLYEDKSAFLEKDRVGLGQLWNEALIKSDVGKIVTDFADPVKMARQIKWRRTKENPKRKRRQKYDKERKFRRKRVHNKIWAMKI